MKQKESWGITFFGVIFILLGIYFLNIPVGYSKLYFSRNPLYGYFYNTAIDKLNDLKNDATEKIKDEETLKNFNKKIENLNIQLQNYKLKYIEHNHIPLSVKLIIIIGLVIGITYIFAGIAILRLFKFTIKLIRWVVTIGILIFPLIIWEVYNNLSIIISFINKTVELTKIITPDFKSELNLSNTFNVIFKNPQGKILLTTLILYIIYASVVLFFFNRKKIKQQFID